MAISLKAGGTWATLTADGGVTIPGSPADGDRMYLFAAWKTFSITASVSGWIEVDESADGTTAAGNGTGSMKNGVWYRDWQSGDGDPTLDFSASPTIAGAVIQLWQKDASETWDTPDFTNANHTFGTLPEGVFSGGANTVKSGAVVMCLVSVRDDSGTFTRPTNGIGDQGGDVTWNGNYVEEPASHLSTTTGQDMAADLGYRLVTTGNTNINYACSVTALSAEETGRVTWVHQGATELAVRPPFYPRPLQRQLLAH